MKTNEFFEMMGSWSLGDYFKEDRTKWSFELLTKVFELPRERLAATVFAGNESVPRDNDTAQLREKSGFLKENIYFLHFYKNKLNYLDYKTF